MNAQETEVTTQRDEEESDSLAELSVGRFIDQLGVLSPSDWLLAGTLANDVAEQRSEPIRNLEQLIASRRLGVAAWLASDSVATAAYLAFPSCLSTVSRTAELKARRAAEVAAHAVLARKNLSSKDFALLYLPFMTLIPPDIL